jgi:hypothetical protein
MMSPEQHQDSLAVEVWFQIEKDSEGYPKSRDSEGLLCTPLDPECPLCRINIVPESSLRDTLQDSGYQIDFILHRN